MPTTDPSTDSAADREGDDDLDLAVLVGTLASDPTVLDLASGSTLVRYEVTVRDRSPADSVPVVWFDPPRAPALAAGNRVVVLGRVRRRFYRAGGATRSSTEVVADTVRRADRARTVDRVLADAATRLGRDA